MPDYFQTFYRNYDAAIGRFIGIDPLAESADALTGYQYAGNNPVMGNDPMGDIYRLTKAGTGQIINRGQGFLNPNLLGKGGDFDVFGVGGVGDGSGGSGGSGNGGSDDTFAPYQEQSRATLIKEAQEGDMNAIDELLYRLGGGTSVSLTDENGNYLRRNEDGQWGYYFAGGTGYFNADHSIKFDANGNDEGNIYTIWGFNSIDVSSNNANQGGDSNMIDRFTTNFGIGASLLENLSGKTQMGNWGKLYFENPATGRVFTGNQWGNTLGLAKTGKMLGRGIALYQLGSDLTKLANGTEHPAQFSANQFMTWTGVYGGPVGAIISGDILR